MKNKLYVVFITIIITLLLSVDQVDIKMLDKKYRYTGIGEKILVFKTLDKIYYR